MWAKKAGGDYKFNDEYGTGIAVDQLGNVYITGYFENFANFGAITIISKNYSNDIFVAKYDNSGNELWVKSAGGNGEDFSRAITVDRLGNTYVTGGFEDTATFGSTTLISAGRDDIFVAKFNASGNVLWARSAGGNGWDEGLGIAVDGSGNAYVTGYYDDTATFGSTTLISAGRDDLFLARYEASGNVLWARSAGGKYSEKGNGIAVDGSGNAYVTGYFSNTASFGSTTLNGAGSYDLFVARYEASGNVLWARSAGNKYSEKGNGIAVDGSGNAYVMGYFSNTASFGSTTLTSASETDIFVAKYDTLGNVLWTKSAGSTEYDYGNAITVDSLGNAYITGYFYSDIVTFGSTKLFRKGF